MIKQCFIDMDGILVDYNAGIRKLFDVPDVYDNPNNLGIFSLASLLEKEYGISKAEFYKQRGQDFYAKLNWTPEGPKILELLEEKFGKKNCFILSAPGFNPCDYAGKAQWIIDNIPDYMYKKRFILNSNKSIEANDSRLLVDDKDTNISGFIQAGGKGILVARPWNAKHGFAGETLEDFKRELDGINSTDSINPSKESLDKLREIITKNVSSGEMIDLIWGPEIDYRPNKPKAE